MTSWPKETAGTVLFCGHDGFQVYNRICCDARENYNTFEVDVVILRHLTQTLNIFQ